MKIFNTNYNLKGVNTKIVLISDIHYYNKNDIKHLNNVLDNIKKIKPKYICITGDLTDESNIYDEDKMIEWLIKLANISKVILSIGNHEYYINKHKKIFGLNKKLYNKIKKINNLYLLDNDNILFDNINFIGLTLPMECYLVEDKKDSSIRKYLEKLNTDKKYYNILLCHSPVNISDERNLKGFDFNLVLCGHTHGGITPRVFRPVLKNRGLVSPRKGILPKVSYGHIKVNNTDIVITSGITVVSHINPFRILKNFFASEIVSIDISR